MSKFTDEEYATIARSVITATPENPSVVQRFLELWPLRSHKTLNKVERLFTKYAIKESGKWFKIETGNWILKPDGEVNYQPGFVTASSSDLIEAFLCVFTVFQRLKTTPLPIPQIPPPPRVVSSIPIPPPRVSPPSQPPRIETFDFLGRDDPGPRRPLGPLKIHVWANEQRRGESKSWYGKPTFTAETRLCFSCLNMIGIDDSEVAHIVPHAAGGHDVVDNLRLLCRSCNRSMSNIHAYEWLIRNQATGIKLIEESDPHMTTAVALYILNELCTGLATELPSIRESPMIRLYKYASILRRAGGTRYSREILGYLPREFWNPSKRHPLSTT